MDRQTAVKKLKAFLGLQRGVVGVKLVKSWQEYARYQGIELKKPLHYCVAVKSAMKGHSIKMDRTTAGCGGGNRALGLAESPPEFFDGTNGAKLGLYKDAAVAAAVAHAVPICPPDTYGVVIKPLEMFEGDPDVVLLAAPPRTIMRVLLGYTYTYGLPQGMQMSGNRAVCLECTATPLKTRSLNVSMFCAGTRYNAGWQDHEALTGIPFNRFYGTVKGIEDTVNPIELDKEKKRIEAELRRDDALEIEVEYGKTYFKQY
ncbi:MAG: DUF169 domain-containing protein [Clostridia bacterium]|jgi:uncharacterized protein (DUF169 family)|nr:DUF169 domain-containing protein [Clostridia bacterium]